MSTLCLDIAMLGLSITSSWGNGPLVATSH